MKVTRILSAVLALLVLCLAAAACSPGGTSQSTSSQVSSGSQSSQSSSAPVNTDPIWIPLIGPLTGDNMQYGVSVELGINLRVEEFNDAGGVNGRMIEIESLDDKNDAKETVNVVNGLLDNPDLFLVLGPFSSTCAMAVSPLLQKAEVLHYALNASHPDAVQAGDWVFRGPVTQVHVCTEYARYVYNELGIRTVGIVYLNNDWGKSVNDQFSEEFTRLGGTITNQEAFIEGQTRDFTPMLTKIKDADPEAIFMISQYNDAATAYNQMASLELPQQRLMADSSMRGELLELAGDVIEGAYGVQSFFLENPKPAFVELRKKVNERTGKEVESFIANAYDNMGVICQAILATGGNDKYAIKEYMTNLKDYDGIAGTWGFDENRSPTKPLYVIQVQDGQFAMITST